MLAFNFVVNLIVFLFSMLQCLVMRPVMLAQIPAYLEALALQELCPVSRRKQCQPLQLLTRRWRRCCQNQV